MYRSVLVEKDRGLHQWILRPDAFGHEGEREGDRETWKEMEKQTEEEEEKRERKNKS